MFELDGEHVVSRRARDGERLVLAPWEGSDGRFGGQLGLGDTLPRVPLGALRGEPSAGTSCDCPRCSSCGGDKAEVDRLEWASRMAEADAGQSDFWKIATASDLYMRSTPPGTASPVTEWVSRQWSSAAGWAHILDALHSTPEFTRSYYDATALQAGSQAAQYRQFVWFSDPYVRTTFPKRAGFCICFTFEFTMNVLKIEKIFYKSRRTIESEVKQYQPMVLWGRNVTIGYNYVVTLTFYKRYTLTRWLISGRTCIGERCPPDYLRRTWLGTKSWKKKVRTLKVRFGLHHDFLKWDWKKYHKLKLGPKDYIERGVDQKQREAIVEATEGSGYTYEESHTGRDQTFPDE
jgi:hypothetical protein